MGMRAFFGGQIKEECRGKLATIVSRQRLNDAESPFFNVFLYSIDSDEFIHLTGVRDVSNPLERVYIGVSHEAGDKIATLLNGRHIDAVILRDIDKEFVGSYFLDRYLDKPSRIVLESTRDGYEIIKEK